MRWKHDLRAVDIKGVAGESGDAGASPRRPARPAHSATERCWGRASSVRRRDRDRTGLQDQLSGSKRELEKAYEELQSTVEELETTNEELQSTNEELETTNEELQSTNEELETMNEELQSTNEELETMNEELRHRTRELNEVNGFLETILTTIGLAVAVLDRDQQRADLERTGARALGPDAGGGRGRAPDGARRRAAVRAAPTADPRQSGRPRSEREGVVARCDQPAG